MTLLHTSLLAAAGEGDPSARERLLALCAPVLRGVARRTLARDYVWDIEDAEQTSRLAFIACAARHSATSAAGWTAYASTAALRDCLRERRLYHRGWVIPEEPKADAAVIDPNEPAEECATVASADVAALRSAEAAHLRELVDRLPEPLRATLVRRYGLDGQEPSTQQETARALGISQQAAQKRERRALEALRITLREIGR